MRFITKLLKSQYFRITVAVILMYFIISRFDINLGELINHIKYPEYILVVMVLTLVINPIVSNKRWQIFLRFSEIHIPMIKLIKISFISIFYALLLPSGQAADGFRMYAIEKLYPGKRGVSGGTVIADRMIGFLIFCFIASFGSLYLPDNPNTAKIRYFVFGFTFILVLLTFLITFKPMYRWVSGVLKRIPFFKGMFSYLDQIYLGITEFQYKQIVPKVIPLVIIYQLTNILIAHLIFLSFDYHIPFYYHLALIPVIQVITILPISVASLGVREGLFIYFYGLIQIPNDISFTVSLLYVLLTGVLSSVVGGILAIFSKKEMIRPKTDDDNTPIPESSDRVSS